MKKLYLLLKNFPFRFFGVFITAFCCAIGNTYLSVLMMIGIDYPLNSLKYD